jgi:hypothetical protein
MRRVAYSCVVAVFSYIVFPATGLTIKSGDQNVALSIVASNELPSPAGAIVAQTIQPLNISMSFDGAFGSLESQVVKNPATGDLTFVYTFLPGAAPPGNPGLLPYFVSSVSAAGLSGFTTDVSASDQNANSSMTGFGATLSGSASRSSDGKTITLHVPASGGNITNFFDAMQIATDAKSFDDQGTAVVTADQSDVTPDSQTFSTFEPSISAPPALEVVPMALLVLAAWHWKAHRHAHAI